jgi:hypothetical protein
MLFTGIAAATNTSAVTAQVSGISGTPNVYKDTISGPVLLSGGEIIGLCAFGLFYDQALNAGAGGFHLQEGGGGNPHNTSTVSALLAANASVSGLGSIATLNGVIGSLSGGFTAGTVVGALGSITGILYGASIHGVSGSLSGPVTVGTIAGVTGTLSGVLSAASVSFSGGDALVGLNSTLASITNVTLVPGGVAVSSITVFAAAGTGDAILVAQTGATAFGSISFKGYVPATGTIVVGVQNNLAATTLTLTTVSFRMVDMQFAT